MNGLRERIAQLSPEKRALLEKRAALMANKPSIPRRQPGDPCPVSLSQQRLWFLDQMEPGNAAYNVYRGVLLAGPLDVAALERSLTEILRRHEVLRTTFPVVEGVPVQRVGATVEMRLPVRDASSLPSKEREAEAVRFATEAAGRSFHLARDLLLRAGLLRLAPEEHILALATHHIAVDGWSVGILFRELVALYDAFSRGLDSPLPEPPIQFADYAVWERRQLSGESIERLLAYWNQQLAGMPHVLELPIDRPRPPVLGSRGARYFLAMPGLPLEELRALGRAENATLYMALLAAFQALLARYSGQQDFAIGSPMACREVPEIESLIGCFSNTLVLRANLSGNPNFRELLGRVRETVLGALAHELMPFDKLVEALKPKRDPSRMMLVQVNFRLLTAPLPPRTGAGLNFEFLEIDNQRCKFDLALELLEKPDGLAGFLEYSTDLFHPETMPLIASDYEDLLRAVASAPDTPLSKLDFHPRLERRKAGAEIRAIKRKPVYLPSSGRHGEAAPARKPSKEVPKYELRPATLKDSAFLYDLRALTMKDYVAQMEGWSQERQEAFYMDFDPLHHHIILVDGRPVGAVAYIEKPDEIYWLNLQLLPEAQGKGLGAAITQYLLNKANSRGVPLTGKILKTNSISRIMCEKAGIRMVEETADRYIFSSIPSSKAPDAR
jgi:GNAT superfamily N-acetyltransferase